MHKTFLALFLLICTPLFSSMPLLDFDNQTGSIAVCVPSLSNLDTYALLPVGYARLPLTDEPFEITDSNGTSSRFDIMSGRQVRITQRTREGFLNEISRSLDYLATVCLILTTNGIMCIPKQ